MCVRAMPETSTPKKAADLTSMLVYFPTLSAGIPNLLIRLALPGALAMRPFLDLGPAQPRACIPPQVPGMQEDPDPCAFEVFLDGLPGASRGGHAGALLDL